MTAFILWCRHSVRMNIFWALDILQPSFWDLLMHMKREISYMFDLASCLASSLSNQCVVTWFILCWGGSQYWTECLEFWRGQMVFLDYIMAAFQQTLKCINQLISICLPNSLIVVFLCTKFWLSVCNKSTLTNKSMKTWSDTIWVISKTSPAWKVLLMSLVHLSVRGNYCCRRKWQLEPSLGKYISQTAKDDLLLGEMGCV